MEGFRETIGSPVEERRRRRRRRGLLLLAAVLFVTGAGVLLWSVNDWPPPMLLLIHGEAPAGGPLGRTFEHDLGMEFVEFSPGCYRLGSHIHCTEGDLFGKLSGVFGLSLGVPPVHRPDKGECPPEWIDIERPFWITREVVTVGQLRAFRPGHRKSVKASEPALSIRWSEAVSYCRWLWNGEPGAFRLPTEAELDYSLLHGLPGPPSLEWVGQRSTRQTTVFLGTRYGKASDEQRADFEGHRGICGKPVASRGTARDRRALAGPDTLVPSVAFRVVFSPKGGAEGLWPVGIPGK